MLTGEIVKSIVSLALLILWVALPTLAADVTISGNLTTTGNVTSDPASTTEQGQLTLREDSANGVNSLALQAPDTITANQTCVLENDANFIPDSCVGNGVDNTSAEAITAGLHITRTVDNLDVDDELQRFTSSFSIYSPTASISGFSQAIFPHAILVVFISCSTNVGTATMNVEKRSIGTPNTPGGAISSANIVCDTDGQNTAGIDGANDNISTNDLITPTIISVASSPAVARIYVTYTIDE